MSAATNFGYVVIGRNEGALLAQCFNSLSDSEGGLVYVDSGSSDDSLTIAKTAGAETLRLSADRPFTAARARNEGLERLLALRPGLTFVVFVDGDSALNAHWPRAAAEFLDNHADVAAVAGRVRERHPDASIYNRLCDIEWDAPAGETVACGGIAVMRVQAVQEAGGFNAALGGGEEPELCVRLRERGWKIWRLDRDMAMHDAEIATFGQWFQRIKRGGRAFAEVSSLHRGSPARIWERETRRALVWAGLAPAALLAALVLHPAAALLLAVYPAQVIRMAAVSRKALPRAARAHAWSYSAFMTIAKFAEAAGIIEFAFSRKRAAHASL